MRWFLAVAAAAFGASSDVQANWQFTRWGMTIEELISQRDAAVSVIPEAERAGQYIAIVGDALASSTFIAGDLTTHAVYYFRRGILVGVSVKFLSLSDGDIAFSRMSSQYGKPAEHTVRQFSCRYAATRWFDRARGNSVRFNSSRCDDGSGFSNALYEPIDEAAETGL